MSSSHSIKVSSTLDQKSVESFQDPHHYVVHIKNKSILSFSQPPPESHDPISKALESHM